MKKLPLPVLMVLAFAAMLWLPNLLTKGMFMDGVYHALLGLNLTNGIGNFWAPQTADYAQPAYWDNPQLSPLFLSLHYKVIGNHYWVEKLYSLTWAIAQLLLISSSWRIYFNNNEEVKKYNWLPCMLWMLIPLTSWGYSSNMMENTMSVFTTGCIISFFLFLRTGKNLLLYSVIGGALIFLAILTKGPVALFPLAVPFFFIWVEKELNWKRSLAFMLLQFITLAIIFGFVFYMPAPKYFLHQYLDVQLMRSLKHQFSQSAPPYTIFLQMLKALSPLLGLAAIAAIIKTDATQRTQLFKTALAFIIIGLSASAPIALSAKQNAHYLIPSLPAFALGFACLILPLIVFIQNKLTGVADKLLPIGKTICLVIVTGCTALCIINAGTYSRDEKMLTDLQAIVPLTGAGNLLPASGNLYGDWPLRANLYRHYNKKITMPGEVEPTGYYLVPTGEHVNGGSKIYAGKLYDLYSLKP